MKNISEVNWNAWKPNWDDLPTKPRKIKIRGQVIKQGIFLWLIEAATDFKTAQAAISIARATGSVGATEIHRNATPPFSDGKLIRFAKVSRIEIVKPE